MGVLRHLVVVVPGIGGSVLTAPDGTSAWDVTVRALTHAVIDPGVLDSDRELVATGLVDTLTVLRPWLVVPGYDGLTHHLRTSFGARLRVVDYRKGESVPGEVDVLRVPYDFRRSVAVSADVLGRAVTVAVGDTGRRVIVVAHSMGGLVARYWIGVCGGWRHCRALVTLGTPHRGAPQALDWLFNGAGVGLLRSGAATRELRRWPSAFLPDLAMSLNNLSLRQSETGDRAAALTSITEAVSAYRALVEQNPAAFLFDLARSLTNLLDLLVTLDGDPVRAAAVWDGAGAGLPATSRAELLCHRSRWHRNRSDITAAVADLGTAAALIDLDGPPDDPRALGAARQHVRARLATFDPSDLSRVPFPSWATTPIPEAVMNLANSWIAADWSQRQQILTAPDTPTDRDLLRVLAAVYCDRPELQQWLDVVDDIHTRGRDVVFAEMDAAHATVSLLQGWIRTPSWNASQAFLAGHPALRGPDAVATLEKWSGDKVARQHLAILRLTEHVPAGDVFDAILDPTDARQLLLRVAHTGSAELIAEAWYATPHVAADPFTGTLAAALVRALSDEADYPDEIDQALRAAAEAASTSERRDTLTLLRTLATTRDDRAEQLHRIAAAIAPTRERSN